MQTAFPINVLLRIAHFPLPELESRLGPNRLSGSLLASLHPNPDQSGKLAPSCLPDNAPDQAGDPLCFPPTIHAPPTPLHSRTGFDLTVIYQPFLARVFA